MKKIFTLSLLLFIAGNGLIVTKTQAGFKDILTKLPGQIALHFNSNRDGYYSLAVGLGLLTTAGYALNLSMKQKQSQNDFNNEQKKPTEATDKELNKNLELIASKSSKQFKALAIIGFTIGIPITGFGMYSLLNKK